MNDYIWFILISLLFIFLAILFIRIGWQIFSKQRMDLIISHHTGKVREEDKRSYCRIAGCGVIMIGIGFLISAICSVFVRSHITFVPMLLGILSGIGAFVLAGMKYGR